MFRTQILEQRLARHEMQAIEKFQDRRSTGVLELAAWALGLGEFSSMTFEGKFLKGIP